MQRKALREYFIFIPILGVIIISSVILIGLVHSWGMTMDEKTYRVGVPEIFADLMPEEVQQDIHMAVSDAYMVEEESYDMREEIFESLFSYESLEKYNESLALLSKYISYMRDMQELGDYFDMSVDLSEIRIPMHARYASSIGADVNYKINDISIFEMLGLSQLEPLTRSYIYVWNEEYKLNKGTPVTKMNYVFVCGNRLMLYSETLEGKQKQKGNYQVYIANIQAGTEGYFD